MDHTDANISGADFGIMEAAAAAKQLLSTLPLKNRKVLIIVENLPVPFDRRVWQEATTLARAGATVSVICPRGKNAEKAYDYLDGVHVYRHPQAYEAKGAPGYLLEYGNALFHELRLALKVYRRHGFDTLHGCNPPDLIFLVALPFKMLGVRYLFDHHDINPELYEAKFEKRGFFWRLMVMFERLTFAAADVVISTNESYRTIALERGRKKAEDVFVVRSGPNLARFKPVAPDPALRNGRHFLVGYVGVIGQQEGVDLLLQAIHYIVVMLGRDDVHFSIVGGGPHLEEMRALAVQLGVSEYVTFTGRVADELLLRVLSTADVCVNPDRVNPMNEKSTMNKVLEYMALGKPIVQFDVTEGRVSAEAASLYAAPNDAVDFADKILTLLADPEQRKYRGDVGWRRVLSQLAWDYEIPKLISAYQRVGR